MIDVLQFIFSSFWIFAGTCVLLYLCVFALGSLNGLITINRKVVYKDKEDDK